MPKVVDPDLLIELVRARPVLWDKTLAIHKDRFETTQAWHEVFKELKSDFSKLNDEKKKLFGKEAMKKWVNIRDAFNKARKKEMGNNGATKKYIYSDQLQFLTKLPLHHSREDSLSTGSANDNSEQMESDDGEDRKPYLEQLNKRLKIELVEPTPQSYFEAGTMTLHQPEDRHMSFFKGIVPSLYSFTDDESIQFQMGVLQLISDIKQNRFHPLTDT